MLSLHRKRVPIKSTPIRFLSPICHKIAFIATESPSAYPHNHPKFLSARENNLLHNNICYHIYLSKHHTQLIWVNSLKSFVSFIYIVRFPSERVVSKSVYI